MGRAAITAGAAIACVAVGIGIVWLRQHSTLTRDADGRITEPGSLAAADLQLGDCFRGLSGGQLVFEVQGVPCDDLHDGEVYHRFDLDGGPEASFPDRATIDRAALAGCIEEFEAFIGVAYANSAYDTAWTAPSDQSWNDGDRTVLCLVTRLDGSQTVGSARGFRG